MSMAKATTNKPLSVNEEKLLSLLPKDGTIVSTNDLVGRGYVGKRKPLHARQIVYGRLVSLQRKLDFNKHPLRIGRTPRAGPHPVSFWTESR
mgnify:CR=1 FL=1